MHRNSWITGWRIVETNFGPCPILHETSAEEQTHVVQILERFEVDLLQLRQDDLARATRYSRDRARMASIGLVGDTVALHDAVETAAMLLLQQVRHCSLGAATEAA